MDLKIKAHSFALDTQMHGRSRDGFQKAKRSSRSALSGAFKYTAVGSLNRLWVFLFVGSPRFQPSYIEGAISLRS
jgi:hypothetical protein